MIEPDISAIIPKMVGNATQQQHMRGIRRAHGKGVGWRKLAQKYKTRPDDFQYETRHLDEVQIKVDGEEQRRK